MSRGLFRFQSRESPGYKPVECELLFVYGTLRRGFERHVLLRRLGAGFVGKGNVAGELFDLGSFPGAVKPASKHADDPGSDRALSGDAFAASRPRRVGGEVFRLLNPHSAFMTLDAYEGFRPGSATQSLYSRELTRVTLESGERTTAWIYWLRRAPKGKPRISSGDYAVRA